MKSGSRNRAGLIRGIETSGGPAHTTRPETQAARLGRSLALLDITLRSR